ncbi:DUF917 family protein [Pseudomonas sp. JV241A]|uniref:S-methyl thiohydantoin desulfurase domain-containing protein n=1 Tax=Pseudomonas sp. JV241A TaxID=2078785 RepID=UPI00100C8D7B|nr:DUF917 family protein [Pseudomonas sp. JV241A]SPO66750.1 conserved protein of unknown function [Pseudomonas sp. JV241A]
MAFELEHKDMRALIDGGCFFGSGGGGTRTSALHLLEHFQVGDFYPATRVSVVSVEEVEEGDAGVLAYMGAPEAIAGCRYPLGPVQALQSLARRLASEGRRLAYVVPPESGALGFLVACLAAARLGLAVVDADGAGRAVPSLPMLTFAAAQVPPRPAFVVSHNGLEVELNVTPPVDAADYSDDASVIAEQMLRPIVASPAFGEFGGLALWVMSPEQLHRALPIRATLSRALALGRALHAGELGSTEALLAFLANRCGIQARVLCGPARIDHAGANTMGGFDIGTIDLQSADASLRLCYENESLLLWDKQQAQPLAMAPDSISWFIPGSGPGPQVASNGDLVGNDGALVGPYSGRPVCLLGWQAEAPLRVPGGLILWSFQQLLAGLGYPGPYRSVGQLQELRS